MFTYIVNGENGATFMPGSPDVTTFHRISVRKDAAAPVFTDPYRSDVELTASMPTVDVRILGHAYPSTGIYSTDAAQHATVTAARSTPLKHPPAHWPPSFRRSSKAARYSWFDSFERQRGYDPTELAVDKNEASNLVNYILARKPFTLSRLERYRNTNGRK